MSTKSHPDDSPDSATAEPGKLRDFAENRADEIAPGSGAAPAEPGDPSCSTQPLVPAFSICLLRKRSCPYAMSFGHQYLCRHPNHAKFLLPSTRHKK